MHKLEFILRQHTPLIHFQHDQEGATLRATEVKPKLDRFILKNYRPQIENLIKTTSNGDEFLDYKIFIQADKSEVLYVSLSPEIENTEGENYENRKIQSFFGNIGIETKKEAKCAIFTTTNVKVDIFCLNETLRNLINQQFSVFLGDTNFGTRQNKGFGSFYIKNKPLNDLKKRYLYFTINSTDTTKVLNDINLFYRCLRSGINQKTSTKRDENGKKIIEDAFYFKSLMFMYAKNKGLTWDKRTMRESFYLNNQRYEQVKVDRTDPNGTVNWKGSNDQHYLFRDALGLSSEQSWLSYNDSISKSDIQKESNGKDVIERFKSPITFKPIKEGNTYVVFIILEDIPIAYKNATFKVTSRIGGNNNMPIYPDFDLSEFLNFCIGLDIDNHFVETNVSNQTHREEIATIKKIFAELKLKIK